MSPPIFNILTSRFIIIWFYLPGIWVLPACAQQLSTAIQLNQVGFYPNGPKMAVVEGTEAGKFFITSANLQDTVFMGELGKERQSRFSDKTTRLADFSAVHDTATFVIMVPGVGASNTFQIQPQPMLGVAKASIKAFYFQRMSMPITKAYGGKWARAAGHLDNQVLVHPSAASDKRPAGSTLSAPGGWYDAGDYNKYIVNSGITTGTLLSLYEDFPSFFDTLNLNIPESENQIPDLLDEILYNLRWMLTMQDPNDGGVYHKLTSARFDGMIMPAEATIPRYVVQKGTAATLDLAAVAAQASRIFRKFERQLPGLADSCLQAATHAWDWAKQHPALAYDQNAMNEQFDPDVSTGAYGDRTFDDEWIWAASELYVTTKNDAYYQAVNLFPDQQMPLPSWAQVRLLGYYTLLRHGADLTAIAQKDVLALQTQLKAMADELIAGIDQQPYHTVMGKTEQDYIWGSNAVAANQGIALLQAYRLSKDKRYASAALDNLDYLLGRNATGYSFLTGYGHKTPMHPHHRLSEADGIDDPIPGLLSGGPNARAPQQDHCTSYTATAADEVFTDDVCSYASNEIAINWNAPFAYLAVALEALQVDLGWAGEIK